MVVTSLRASHTPANHNNLYLSSFLRTQESRLGAKR